MGFYGGTDTRASESWLRVDVAGCWATAMKEMNRWIAADKDHVDGGLTGTIMALGNVDKWTTSDANCLDVADMDCAPAPAPLDATVLQVGPADEEAPDHDEESSSDDEE